MASPTSRFPGIILSGYAIPNLAYVGSNVRNHFGYDILS